MITLKAFEIAAGVSAAQISIVVRSTIAAAFFLWAGWNVLGQYKLLQANEIDLTDFPLSLLRVLLLCSLMVTLVFVV